MTRIERSEPDNPPDTGERPDSGRRDEPAPQISADSLARRIALGLFVAVFLIYGGSLTFDFVRLDDFQYVVENAHVRNPSLAGLARFFSEVMRPSSVDGYYQPLTMASYMLDSLIVGRPDAGPGIFRFTNVLIHAINAALVFMLLRRVLQLHRREGAGVTVEHFFAPAVAAAVFALHPAQVESVCWISQRKTVLATMFVLAAMLSYLRHGAAGRRGTPWAAWVLYLLATMAKPTTVLFPLVLPLLDRWPLRRTLRHQIATGGTLWHRFATGGALWHRFATGVAGGHLSAKWPFAVVMVVMGWAAWVSQSAVPEAVGLPALSNPSLWLRWVELLSYNFMLYMGNLLWPMQLSPYRDLPGELSLGRPAIVASLAGTAILVAAWLVAWRRSAPAWVGLTAFVILLSPTLGGIRFTGTCVADRFLYLPMVFLLMPLTVLLWRGDVFMRRRAGAFRISAALLLVPFIVLTRAQQRVWADSKTLFTHIAASAPGTPKTTVYLASIALDEQDYPAALAYAQEAARRSPGDSEACAVLGKALVMNGRAAEGSVWIRQALEIGMGPNQASGWVELAAALTHGGDIGQVRAASEKAIALGREKSEVLAAAADEAMRRAKNTELAIALYREAVAANANNAIAQWNLGTSLAAAGRLNDALACYELAIDLRKRAGRPTAELDAPLVALRAKLATQATQPAAENPSPAGGS